MTQKYPDLDMHQLSKQISIEGNGTKLQSLKKELRQPLQERYFKALIKSKDYKQQLLITTYM